ncbi:MAG: hypothetical protein GX542_06190, partial [Rhodococcus sp.]|nr:hypothetical protein [Rhodococcus sp. (in: high G+C Gram-positive bacteria)]
MMARPRDSRSRLDSAARWLEALAELLAADSSLEDEVADELPGRGKLNACELELVLLEPPPVSPLPEVD